MSTRLTRRGQIVVVGAVIAASISVGIATGNVCWWGACSDITSPQQVEPMTAAERSQVSEMYGPIAEPTAPRERQTRHVSRSAQRSTLACHDRLDRVLARAGFQGENRREAWAIAMRESNGVPTTVGSGVDVGLFQFNRPTWGSASWWDESALLTADYNARIAYRLSDGGSTWAHWGLDGSGRTDASLYGMWSDAQVWAWITEPYQRYYSQYPC
jgi:hypothetical protein